MDWDRLRLPQKFSSVVNGQEPRELALLVFGGSTGMCPVAVLFDRVGQMFLHTGWR
jgi:hypothetical protein